MASIIQLGDITVDVIHKDIKNIHLSVYPPTGAVRISAPLRMELDTIRIFALDKLGWIKKQQQKLREQERETPREYLDRESHYLWGKRYLLKISEEPQAPKVSLTHSEIILQVRLGTDTKKRGRRCQPWRAKRRLVDPSSREAALFSRRALRQRENKVGLRTRRPVIWESSTEQQRACEVVAKLLRSAW